MRKGVAYTLGEEKKKEEKIPKGGERGAEVGNLEKRFRDSTRDNEHTCSRSRNSISRRSNGPTRRPP